MTQPMHVLFREGYRLFFPWSALVGLGLTVLWGGSFAGGWAMPMPPQTHGMAMLLGVWGAAILGFLLTAYPRQNEAAPPGRALIAGLLALHGLSILAILPTGALLPVALRVVAAAAPWLVAAGWSAMIARASLARRYDGTTAAVPIAFLAAAIAAGCFVAGATDSGVRLAIHGFAVVAGLSVLDRVLPFFSSRLVPSYTGRRAPGFTPLLVAAALLRVCVPALPWLGDIALIALILRQLWGWQPWPAAREPMLGVIHLGVAWLIVGYVLDAAGAKPASLAAHAWLLGGLGTLWAGVTMRVTRGHSGQPIHMGVDGAVIVAAVQLAAATRLFAGATAAGPGVYAVASLFLAVAWLGWLVRLGPLVARHA